MSTHSPSSGASTNHGEKAALVQIGHYVLGETLGIGTFGKVKGKSGLLLHDLRTDDDWPPLSFQWVSTR